MDVLSHGLWGGVTFGRRNKGDFISAFTFGVLPDVVAFGPLFVHQLFNPALRVRPDYASGHPDLSLLPDYVMQIYNYSHSLVIFAIVFFLMWAMRGRPLMPMLAWGLHILFDIPTHSTAFFPTPFLWPLSDVTVNGIPWGRPWIFFPNVMLLLIFYSAWFIHYRKNKKSGPAHAAQS